VFDGYGRIVNVGSDEIECDWDKFGIEGVDGADSRFVWGEDKGRGFRNGVVIV